MMLEAWQAHATFVETLTTGIGRPSWDLYFMMLATLTASRATCDRKHVGAVIVNGRNRVVAGGYNGAPAGMPHCDDVGHQLKEIEGRQSCVRTLHAESNALDAAGPLAECCTLYVTVTPCYPCAQRIVNAGITRVVYGEWYDSQNTDLVAELFKQAGVQFETLGAQAEQVTCETCGEIHEPGKYLLC